MSDLSKLPSEIVFLIEAVRSAPSADNSQPWCFDWDGNYLTVRVHGRGGFPTDCHATRLALGAASENLFRAMQFLGLDVSSWYFGLPENDGIFARGPVSSQTNAIEPCITPLWKLRHTNRLPYYLEIDQHISQQLSSCRVDRVGVDVLMGENLRKASVWVKQASEIRFQTRELHNWFVSSLRYGISTEDVSDGLHVNTLALPPGGVWLLKLISNWSNMQWLNRMRAYKFFAAIEAANFRKTPLIVAITGPSNKDSVFNAGRCLQQVWLKVTELGLAAHPYYVVSDLLNRLTSGGVPTQCVVQALDLQDQIRMSLGPDVTLHCLLRVGIPISNIQFSGRIPVNNLMCNTTNKG